MRVSRAASLPSELTFKFYILIVPISVRVPTSKSPDVDGSAGTSQAGLVSDAR